VLLGYRLSGVDKDDATREKVRSLADKMTELSMSFSRTVAGRCAQDFSR